MSTTISEKKRKRREIATESIEKSQPRSQPRTLYYAIAAIMIAVFISYANSLGNEFVFDDKDLVVGAIRNQRFTEIGNLLTSYRPVRTITYAIDYAIWGQQPLGFHLTNILIHAGSSVLVFLLIRRLTGAITVSLLGALLFAVHPIQTDSVTYISGRRDVLCGFFYMAAFLTYLGYRTDRARSRLILFIAFWVLSLLSKEMAVSFPVVIFLWEFCELWNRQEGSLIVRAIRAARAAIVKDRWLYVVLLVIDVAFSLYSVFGERASQRIGSEGASYYGGSLYATLLTSARAQAWYLKQLVFPTPISQYHGAFDLSHSIFDWRVLASLAVVCSVIGSGIVLLKYNRVMAFAILAYFAMLAPVSQIVPHHEFAADHYLYIPMACFALLVALTAQRLAARSEAIKRAAYATIIVAVITLSALTVMRNRVWKDGFTLWQENYQAVPTSSRAAFNLASEYESRNIRRAEELFRKSINVDPSLNIAYTKLSKLYLTQNRVKEAEELIEGGLALSDEEVKQLSGRKAGRFRSELLTALAAVRNQQGRGNEAAELLRESLDLNPTNTISRMMLASHYKSTDRKKYLDALKEGVQASPQSVEILKTLAGELIEDREYEEAVLYLKKVTEVKSRDFYANYQLGRSYRILKNCQGAVESSRTALESAVTTDEVTNARDLVQVVARECGAR